MMMIRRNISITYLGMLLLLGTPPGCGPEGSLGPGAPPLAELHQAEGLGKDGDMTVSAADTIVNRYAQLAADARRGDTTLTLSATSGLGIDALMPLAPDDLLLIIQMQGADIDTTNSLRYGEVIDLRSAGLYEFIGVVSVDQASRTITVYSVLQLVPDGSDGERSSKLGVCELGIRLAQAEALWALGERSQAVQLLLGALALMQARAREIPSRQWQDKFLHSIPEHLRARELARQWLPEGQMTAEPVPGSLEAG